MGQQWVERRIVHLWSPHLPQPSAVQTKDRLACVDAAPNALQVSSTPARASLAAAHAAAAEYSARIDDHPRDNVIEGLDRSLPPPAHTLLCIVQ
jgi:hypothetical protein